MTDKHDDYLEQYDKDREEWEREFAKTKEQNDRFDKLMDRLEKWLDDQQSSPVAFVQTSQGV